MLALAAAIVVVCAPGAPGSTGEAQPAMDALARSVAKAAHLPAGSMGAVYEQTEAGCLRRLAEKDAALLLATLPFYLAHEQQLRLAPRRSGTAHGGGALRGRTMVTGQGPPFCP